MRWWAALPLSVLLVPACLAGSEATREQIQAAYLCRFLDFIEWPPAAFAAGGKLSLCVLGDGTLAHALEKSAKGLSISGRAVEVRQPVNVSEAQACHVLFLTGRPQAVSAQLADLRLAPILTASDLTNFDNAGGIVTFYFKGGRMLFGINVENAKKRGLSISSQLVQLSRSAQ